MAVINHQPLKLTDWEDGSKNILTVWDEADSITVDVATNQANINLTVGARLTPGDVGALIRRLTDIAATRGWNIEE